MRQLKGLEQMISVSVVHPLMLENGWTFATDFPAATGDDLYQHDFLYQLYQHADAQYSGRVTVPVLWDKQQQTIVSNESADIIRMLNSAFDAVGARAGDYYPVALREKSMSLTAGSMTRSITASIRRASPPRRRPTRKRRPRCSSR